MKVNIPKLFFWNQIMFTNNETNRQLCFKLDLCSKRELSILTESQINEPYLYIEKKNLKDNDLNSPFIVSSYGSADSDDLVLPTPFVEPLLSYVQLTKPSLESTIQFLNQLLNP